MKKTSIAYIVGALVVIAGGVYFAVSFGMRPKPVPKISWSHFETADEFGVNIYKRLRLEVQSQNLLFLGVLPERKAHYQVWNGFLDSLEPEHKYEHIIVDSGLPHKSLLKYSEEISLIENQNTIVATVKEIIQTKKKVAIVLPTQYMSYLVKDNLYSMLNRSLYGQQKSPKFDVDWITFSLSSFPMNREQEKSLDIPCDTDPKDKSGSGALGCMILLKAKTLYRKKHLENKIPGVLDQIGTKEYLGLIN